MILRRFAAVVSLLAAACTAQGEAASRPASRPVHGRIENFRDLRIAHVWGKPDERGYAEQTEHQPHPCLRTLGRRRRNLRRLVGVVRDIGHGCSRRDVRAIVSPSSRCNANRLMLIDNLRALLGDRLYAEGEALTLRDRLCLHASMLCLTHPQTGERLRFESPAPF